jgi:GNAT superfamily N-acetyltransferase
VTDDTATPRIRLRRVRDDDADDLAAAWLDQAERYADLAPDVFRVPARDGVGRWLVEQLAAEADPKRRLVLVADVDGTAAGFVVAAVVAPHGAARFQMQRDLVDRQVRIEALAVQRRFQRRGVGARLARAAEDWARNRGARTVSAQAYVRGPARAFFDTLGYEPRATVVTRAL